MTESPEKLKQSPLEIENQEPATETSRNPQSFEDSRNSPETPKNNPETDASEAEDNFIIRSEKYNLRPTPKPNYSYSYKYLKKTNHQAQRL